MTVWNLLDFAACTFPVTFADKTIDKPRNMKRFKSMSELDGKIQADYDAEFYHGAPQNYCSDQTNVRHGYLLSQMEVVAVRVSCETIGPGLASSRSARQTGPEAASHNRSVSLSSGVSSTSLTTTSWKPDDRGVEYGVLDFLSVPWSDHGDNRLTVKLVIWGLHMFAMAGSISTRPRYPPLDSWVAVGGKFCHATTGRCLAKAPKGAVVISSEQDKQPAEQEDPSNEDEAEVLTVETFKAVGWDSQNVRFMYLTNDGRCGTFEKEAQIWSTSRPTFRRFDKEFYLPFLFFLVLFR